VFFSVPPPSLYRSLSSLAIGSPGSADSTSMCISSSSSGSSSSNLDYPSYGNGRPPITVGFSIQRPSKTMIQQCLETLDRDSLGIHEILFANAQKIPSTDDGGACS
jgi:hypothetical protein